jgi:hypothetical protein
MQAAEGGPSRVAPRLRAGIAALLAVAPCVWAAEAGPWRFWGIEDGFTEAFIASMVAGPDGRIGLKHGRIGSMEFLDGYRIENIQVPPSLEWEMGISRGGLLWANDETAGLLVRRAGAWVPLNRINRKALVLDERRVILPEPDRLVSYDPGAGSDRVIRRADQTRLGEFRNLVLTRDGNRMWILGTRGIGCSSFDGGEWEEYRWIRPG